MPLLDFFKSKKILGLDVGSYAIKLVELKAKKKSGEIIYELESIGYEPVPYQSIVEGSIMDAPAVADAIQRVFYENKIKTNNVCIGVSGSSVIVKKFEVQRTSPDELHEQILWEARPHLPFDSEDVAIDYEVIESPDIPPERVGVVLAAVRRDKLNEYLNVLTIADKNVEIIDVESFALLNSVLYNNEFYRDKTIAIINIGASVTNVIIGKNGYPVLVRDISFGGNQFTDMIQKELNLKYEKAEAIKKGRQIEGVSQAAVKPVINIMYNELKQEIMKTFEFYRSGSDGGMIDNIVLSGGTASLENITEMFSADFSIPVEVFNPFNRIEINTKKGDFDYINDIAPVFSVAVGLAIRATGESK